MVCKRIKDYLDKNGIKLSYVAAKIGMKESTFSMKLKGNIKMTVEEYIAICDALGISCDLFRTIAS